MEAGKNPPLGGILIKSLVSKKREIISASVITTS